MTVPKLLLPVLMIAAVLGSVLVGQATGAWQVSGKAMIDVNSLTSTQDIKGWMTIQQISTGFDIDLPTLYAVIGLPAEIAPETAMKDLEKIVPGFETSLVREKLAEYLETGQVLSAESGDPALVITPAPAITPTPAPEPSPTAHAPVQAGEDAANGPGNSTEYGSGEGGGPTPLPPGVYLAAAEIKGRTTLNEIILNGQVDKDALLTALGLPANTNLNTAAKDLIGQGKVTEVQTIRDVVAELQKK